MAVLSKSGGRAETVGLSSAGEGSHTAPPAPETEAAPGTEEIPDFTGMSPIQILDWLGENPSPCVPGGWGDDPHRELREMRERDAEIEEERELERRSLRVAEPDASGER